MRYDVWEQLHAFMEPERIAINVSKVEAEKILQKEKEKYDPIGIWIAEHQEL